MRKVIKNILILLAMFYIADCEAQSRVGDPDVRFDESKYDEDYPQMLEWQKAGVEGGIPFLSNSFEKTISATNSDGLMEAIDEVAALGGGQIKLENGTYDIDKEVNVKSNVRLIGEDREQVILNISMTGESGSAIIFKGEHAGMDQLTIQGGHGVPPAFSMENLKADFQLTSVYFNSSSKNCWIDKVTILNSGKNALSIWKGSHITVRDCYIEGAWNKGGGGTGYVQFSGDHCLMYNTTVKKMRHIIIQREGCQYNVFYQNEVEQDFNFHNADAGYNLVEQNISRLSSELGNNWHAMMGPWSVQHDDPGPGNVVYKNDCIENNNEGAITFSDSSLVYVPVRHEQDEGGAFDTNNNTPNGGTFYPIILATTNATTTIFEDPVLVYPNPFSSSLSISNYEGFRELSFIDVFGRVVKKIALDRESSLHLFEGLDYLLSGYYLLRLEGESRTIMKKIIKH